MLRNDLAALVAAAVCIVSGCIDQPLYTEDVELEEYDAKTDSLLTHTLMMTITDSIEIDARSWPRYKYEHWESNVSITDHSADSVSMSATELLFYPPPPTTEPDDPGWFAYLRSGDSGPLAFGTELSMLIWSRPAGSNAEWAPVQFPATATSEWSSAGGRFLSSFAFYPTSNELAYVNAPPTKTCQVVFDQGNVPGGSFTFNTWTSLPQLDRDSEYRFWVVPSYNFCEWTHRSYRFEVSLTRDVAWEGAPGE